MLSFLGTLYLIVVDWIVCVFKMFLGKAAILTGITLFVLYEVCGLAKDPQGGVSASIA